VTAAGAFTLTDSTIATSGNTSSQDSSSFYGLNAAVLAEAGSRITLSRCEIRTTGTGANGAFATGSGSSVVLSDATINATANGAHGVMATQSGSMTLTNVDMTTAGANAGAIATDRGGGTIIVTGGTVTTSGQDSPGIYSTGSISVTGGTISATGAEAAAIEGANSITLTNTDLPSTMPKWGVMVYQSMSGDASGTRGTLTMTGGSLTYSPTSGPLFYVTNSTGIITLSGVDVIANSGTILKASAGSWGSSGGTAVFTATGQSLIGSVVGDSVSSITATLQNGSSLTGAVNPDGAAESVSLTLDSSSTWTLTADSYVTTLADPGGILGTSVTNIVGNGHTVYYDASSSSQLGGLTYSLTSGGRLTPR
jgi:hypothetical protein